LAPTLGAVAANLDMSAAAIADAVAAGADVAVLPELVTSGYMFADTEEARAAALPADDAAFAAWLHAAGDAVVIAGFCELGADDALYNTAAVIESGSMIATYRKTHLWDREKLIFTPGDRLPEVLHTRHGAIAVMVCYDLEFGEVTRRVAVAGAELIAAPVNWPRTARPKGERCGELITAMSAARTNHVAVAVCDRAGTERGATFAESTAIISADGWVVAETGPGVGTALADLDLAASRDKRVADYVDLLADRRLDLY
jgi:predicted amidohydrolase